MDGWLKMANSGFARVNEAGKIGHLAGKNSSLGDFFLPESRFGWKKRRFGILHFAK